MKITKSKLKQLIKEEIEAVREEYSDDDESIFEPSTYEGMFDSGDIETFEDSLREFVGNYLDEEDLTTLEDDEIEDLKAAVMTALEDAEEADSEARMIVKTALEDVEAAIRAGDLG